MNAEKILIERANLSSSAIARSPRDASDVKLLDEESLIEKAILAKSQRERIKDETTNHVIEPDKLKNHFQDDEKDGDVFEDADTDEDDKEIEVKVPPIAVIPGKLKLDTEDRHRIQLTEDVLISYAHLSDNELNSKFGEGNNFAEPAKNKEQHLKVPKLDIGCHSDNDENDSDKDGYVTPLNSEQSESGKAERLGKKSRQMAIYGDKGRPERKLLADIDDNLSDGDFDALVIDTANAMNAFDFEDIKTQFRDTEGFEIFLSQDSPILFLNHLRRYRMISRDNLNHLEVIVTRLRNPLLHRRARQYVKQKSETIFFYPESRHVPPGFGTFKLHVSGKDFTRLKRNDLETLRSTVSLIIFLPTNSIYIVGIEPGINLVISLMVPQRCVGTLMKMATEGLPELGKIGVDLVQISGRTFKTEGLITTVASTENEHMKFLTVYHQLREKNRQLEERDAEIVALKEEAEFMKLELETKNAELEMQTERTLREPLDKRHLGGRIKRHIRRKSLPLALSDSQKPTQLALTMFTTMKSNRSVTESVKEDKMVEYKQEDKHKNETHFRNTEEKRLAIERKGCGHDFQWTHSDDIALSSVRQVLERGEIMDEIEGILAELNVPDSEDLRWV